MADKNSQGLNSATVLLLSMGEEAAAQIMTRLPREDVIKIAKNMATLPDTSNDDVRDIIDDFFGRFREHSGIGKADRAYLERTLDMAFGNISKDLVKGIYGEELTEEIAKLDWIQSSFIAQCFKAENIKLQACLLAFMSPEKRAEVLDFLPEESHEELIRRVASLKEIQGNVVEEMKLAIEKCVNSVEGQKSAQIDGTETAAEIINHYKGNKQSLLEMIQHYDKDLAQVVLESMYDMSSLVLQTDETIQALVDSMENETIAVALKGVEEEIKDKIFFALPKRKREEMTEMVEDMGGVSVSKVESAQKELMGLARRMNEEGEIEYIIFEEKVVE